MGAGFSTFQSELDEDGSTLVLQEDSKMPQVTVYKPNGEALLSTNAKKPCPT
jgi:hypothetical protein